MPSRMTSDYRRRSIDANKISVNDLVNRRNRKVAELYCMSRLSDILKINDSKVLKTQIESFVSSNDIKKGKRFYKDALPKVSYLKTPNSTLARKKSDTALLPIDISNAELPNNIEGSRSEPPPYIKEEFPHKISDETNHLKRPLDEEDRLQIKSLEKRSKSSSQESISYNRLLPIQLAKQTEQTKQMVYPGINILPPKATPVEHELNISDPLLKQLSKPKAEELTCYNKDNINKKDYIYLLMNETVPSKIPQALPLAELKYMAQTLPLVNLIPRAHKTLTTEIINNALNESRITVVASRIEELRRLGLWSLRQPKKFIDPWTVNKSHYGILLQEAKWMQNDFKEGQKYKIAVCTTIAQAIMDYWTYGKVCCVETKPIIHIPSSSTQASDDHVEKEESENNEETVQDSTKNKRSLDTNEASALQALGENSANNDNIGKVTVLPASEAPLEKSEKENELIDNSDTSSDLKEIEISTDSTEGDVTTEKFIDISELLKRPNPSEEINFLSNLPTATREEYDSYLKTDSPYPFKLTLGEEDLSRLENTLLEELPTYNGLEEDAQDETSKLPFTPISKAIVSLDDDHFIKLIEKQLVDDEQSILQLSKRRGMFYGNRRSHYLRPPPVPSLRYLQSRTPTIWLPDDDKELVKNINAYGYNWELIAAHMLHKPNKSYLSNMERRTPWQCFERFVQLNERLNFNDLKGPRAHTAQQWLMEAHKFQQRQNRRISPLGVGMESIQRGHRRLRWASMFEAMRKCIRKRENAPKPNPSQPRKPLDIKNMKVPSPAEMAELKAQRDESLRRDIQLRRNAKNRLQQKQLQNSQQNMRSSSRGNQNNPSNSQNTPNNIQMSKTGGSSRTPTPGSSSHKIYTERETIENYSRRIMAQKPDMPLESALKAAENYYKNIKEQQRQQQQQARPTPAQVPKTNGDSNGTNGAKIMSPTPQEILERSQKH